MKVIGLIFIFLPLLGCLTKNSADNTTIFSSERVLVKDLKDILDSSLVTGAILIFDPQKDIYYSNDFKHCDSGFLPASTFKIPNTIIALETGVAKNDSSLFKWNGEKRRLPIWEQDLILRDAFHYSCVPCYQQIAREIGLKRMKSNLLKLKFGKMMVDSSNLDLFWLEGESKITQFEQIDFLKRFYFNELPIKERTIQIMKRLMVIENNDSFKVSGKTGWAIRNNNNIGWFTGYIETHSKVYFFATNLRPKVNFNMDMFPMIRNQITLKAFYKLHLLN
jgi:beta-lactamase class D